MEKSDGSVKTSAVVESGARRTERRREQIRSIVRWSIEKSDGSVKTTAVVGSEARRTAS